MPIDTVRLRFPVDPSRISLVDWTHNKKSRQVADHDWIMKEDWTTQHTSSNGTKMFLVFRSKDLYCPLLDNSLYVEFSFPKLLNGCNHQMISNWDHALDVANSELAHIPGLPPLMDIRDAPLFRLDLCFNLQVGRNVIHYIEALRKAYYPRRDTLAYKNNRRNYNGITFKPPGGGISCSIYDKYEECGCPDAWGILRLEISMRKKPVITKKFGKQDFTLRDMTYDSVMNILRADLKILHLDQDIVCDQLELDRRLHEAFQPRTVRTLLGYLLEKQTKTHEQTINGGTSRRSICNYEKLLRQAGISSLSMAEKVVLPALLPLLSNEGGICNKVLSDTKVSSETSPKEAQMSKKRGQNEGSIFKRKDGLWVAQLTIQGKHVSKYCKSQSECREWLRKTQAQVENGLTLSGAQTSVTAFLSEWLVLNEASVRPKTIDQYKQIVKQHIVPDLGMIKMKDLNPSQIQALYSKKMESGTSARTVILIHAVLRRALNHALKLGMIGRNPALAVTRPKFKRKEMKTLTDSQVRTLLSIAVGDHFEVLFWLAVTTGLRQGELLGLKWSDVDWPNRRLSIQRQLQRLRNGLVFSEPKSAAGRRVIALGITTIAKLRKHQEFQVGNRQTAGESWKENDMIFPSSTGTPMDPSNLYHNFKKLLIKAGLPDIRFHDLRHYVECWIMVSV